MVKRQTTHHPYEKTIEGEDGLNLVPVESEEVLCGRCNLQKPRTSFNLRQLNKQSNTPYICIACLVKLNHPSMSEGESKHQKHKAALSTKGLIYFIQSEDAPYLIKIGFTSYNLKRRFNCLQGMSPSKLKLLATKPGTLADEWNLHHEFEDVCAHHEWHFPVERLLLHIQLITVAKKGG